MIALALMLIVVGLLLSALFSGAETGMYRATRLRLVLDALGGSVTARALLWLANNPSIFVATTLIGNNLAGYLISLAVVLISSQVAVVHGPGADLLWTLVTAPALFIYGELLPKNLFLAAPNLLLRRVGPLMLLFTALFAPITAIVFGVEKLLQRLLRHAPEQVRATLARRELRRALEEGHEAGILHPTQRGLANGVFALGGTPVTRFLNPVAKLPRARSTMSKAEVLGLAQRYRIAIVPVEQAAAPAEEALARGERPPLVGYVRVYDLALDAAEALGPVRPLLRIQDGSTHLAALMALHSAKEEIAAVVRPDGQILGLVLLEQLRDPLLQAK